MLPSEIGLSSNEIEVQHPQNSWTPELLPPTSLQVSQTPQDIHGWMRGADTDLPSGTTFSSCHGGSFVAPGHDL